MPTKEQQREYHVIIDRDDEGELVYNLIKPSVTLDKIVAHGLIARWQFTYCPCSQEITSRVKKGAGV